MRIVHRITVNSTPDVRRELATVGVVVPADGLVTFEADESLPSWLALEQWLTKTGALDLVRTEFTDAEIAEASWLELLATWHRGYPQPREDDFGYLAATYDLTDYCENCGMTVQSLL